MTRADACAQDSIPSSLQPVPKRAPVPVTEKWLQSVEQHLAQPVTASFFDVNWSIMAPLTRYAAELNVFLAKQTIQEPMVHVRHFLTFLHDVCHPFAEHTLGYVLTTPRLAFTQQLSSWDSGLVFAQAEYNEQWCKLRSCMALLRIDRIALFIQMWTATSLTSPNQDTIKLLKSQFESERRKAKAPYEAKFEEDNAADLGTLSSSLQEFYTHEYEDLFYEAHKNVRHLLSFRAALSVAIAALDESTVSLRDLVHFLSTVDVPRTIGLLGF